MNLVEVVVGLVVLVGLVGIVVPVLPGSILIGAAVLVWALDTGSWAWAVFAAVVAMLVAGSVAAYVIPGRRVGTSVPRSTFVVAGIAGLVGFFVVPVVGLFLFFPLGVYLMEHRRLKDPTAARASAWLAVRATALGMVVELLLALLAASTWLLAVLIG